MRNIKLVGLAALAALAALALIGAGSASATVLCDTTPGAGNVCPEEHAYPEFTTLEAHAEDVLFEFPSFNLECKSDMTITTTTAGGAGVAVEGEVQALEFYACSSPGGWSCTLSVHNLPSAASIEHAINANGILRIADGGSGEPGFWMTCAGILACSYSLGEPVLPVFGGDPASMSATRRTMTKTGGAGGCSSTGAWSATYEFTAPTAIYVASS